MKRYLPSLFLLLTFAGCDLFGEPDRAIVIDGVVVEAETGHPLPGIAVRLDAAALSGPVRPILAGDSTDAQGRFEVRRAYNIDGDYRIFATDRRLFSGPVGGYYRTVGPNDFPVQPGDRRSIRIEMVWQER